MRMKSTIVALAALFSTAAHAQEPLPDHVAELYLAYQQAEQSGDLEAILASADAVYREARRARVDDETLGTLAENFGYYAAAAGDGEVAYSAWRHAAELSGPDLVATGYRWQNASTAAIHNGDMGDARRCAMNSSNAFGELDQYENSNIRESAIQSHLLAAQLNVQTGRLRIAGTAADRALVLMEQDDRPVDRYLAMASYYAGLRDLSRNDFGEATFWLHIAGDAFQLTDADETEYRTAYTLSSYASTRNLRDTLGERAYFSREDRVSEERALNDAAFHRRVDDSPLHQQMVHLHSWLPGGAHHEEDSTEEESPQIAPEATQVRRVEPSYPPAAAAAGYEGFIVVRYDVDEGGRVATPEIIVSIPNGVFDEAVLSALDDWRYDPALEDGVPVVRAGVEAQFNFQLRN